MGNKSLCNSDLALEFRVGDLVRLKGDEKMEAGLGLIDRVQRGSEDLLDVIGSLDAFVGKAKVRVLWAKRVPNSTWMDPDEIVHVQSIGIKLLP